MEHRMQMEKSLASYHVYNYFIKYNQHSRVTDIKNIYKYSPANLKCTSDKAKSMHWIFNNTENKIWAGSLSKY